MRSVALAEHLEGVLDLLLREPAVRLCIGVTHLRVTVVCVALIVWLHVAGKALEVGWELLAEVVRNQLEVGLHGFTNFVRISVRTAREPVSFKHGRQSGQLRHHRKPLPHVAHDLQEPLLAPRLHPPVGATRVAPVDFLVELSFDRCDLFFTAEPARAWGCDLTLNLSNGVRDLNFKHREVNVASLHVPAQRSHDRQHVPRQAEKADELARAHELVKPRGLDVSFASSKVGREVGVGSVAVAPAVQVVQCSGQAIVCHGRHLIMGQPPRCCRLGHFVRPGGTVHLHQGFPQPVHPGRGPRVMSTQSFHHVEEPLQIRNLLCGIPGGQGLAMTHTVDGEAVGKQISDYFPHAIVLTTKRGRAV